jgi:hypothetical protein
VLKSHISYNNVILVPCRTRRFLGHYTSTVERLVANIILAVVCFVNLIREELNETERHSPPSDCDTV